LLAKQMLKMLLQKVFILTNLIIVFKNAANGTFSQNMQSKNELIVILFFQANKSRRQVTCFVHILHCFAVLNTPARMFAKYTLDICICIDLILAVVGFQRQVPEIGYH
jgi:hypothetical protein